MKTPQWPLVRQRRRIATIVACSLLMLVPTVRAQDTPLWDDLISYWPFSDGAGMTAVDAAPGGSVTDNGVVRNSPTWITSGVPFGAGLQFDGTSQDVFVPASADLDINAAGVTLSAWVKLDLLPADLPETFAGIYDSAQDNYVMYLDRGNNELRFKATNASGVSTASAQHPGVRAARLNTSDWVHVMGVYDGDSGRVKMYYNGQLEDVTTHTGGASLLTGLVRAGQVASIGADANVPTGETSATPNRFFPGAIAEVAVWNRPLGLAEAQYLYNGGAGQAVGAANPSLTPAAPIAPVAPAAQPVVYYPFDGDLANRGTGGSLYDAQLQGAGVNTELFTPTQFGQGLDLRNNPASNATAGDWLAVDYPLSDEGTIALRFTADKFFNFQSLWDNSAGGNDWEMWIYGDGRVASRANSSTPIVAYNINLEFDPTASQHYAFTWERRGEEMLVRLYVNGEWVDERLGAWRDPGSTFFIGGGNAANHVGSGIWDEFRIYNLALNEGELLYLSQVPEPSSLVIATLVAFGAGAVARRRR